MPYAIPDHDIVSIIDAPPTPLAALSPGGRFIALVRYESHPPVTFLARRYLPLAGIRVDPVIACRQRTHRITGLSVLRVADGAEQALTLPTGAQLSVPAWAPDGQRFAFTVDEPDGIGVWVADAAAGSAAAVPGLRVRDVLGGGGTVRWSRDGSSLIALGAPAGQVALPAPPANRKSRKRPGSDRSWRLSRICCGPPPMRTPSSRWPRQFRSASTRRPGRRRNSGRQGSTCT